MGTSTTLFPMISMDTIIRKAGKETKKKKEKEKWETEKKKKKTYLESTQTIEY